MQLNKLLDRSLPQGDFALVRVMGEPGTEVFQARSRDGRDLVLRFWRTENELDMHNAIAIASNAWGVRHPMLASVLGVREHADGTLSLISEYVPGRTLDGWVAEEGLPPLTIAVDFVRRLALGLHTAHQRGSSHHALYPGNLMVTEPETKPSGRITAKLLDLGVSPWMRSAVRFEAAHFMAPEALVSELANGGRRIAANVRMNVYSCGCLLHYLCTGQPPFQSDSLAGLSALHSAGAVAAASRFNPDIPENLERVIVQALDCDPKRRVSSAAALAALLSSVESGWRSSGVRRKSLPPPPPAANADRAPRVPAFDLVFAPAEPGATTSNATGRGGAVVPPSPAGTVVPGVVSSKLGVSLPSVELPAAPKSVHAVVQPVVSTLETGARVEPEPRLDLADRKSSTRRLQALKAVRALTDRSAKLASEADAGVSQLTAATQHGESSERVAAVLEANPEPGSKPELEANPEPGSKPETEQPARAALQVEAVEQAAGTSLPLEAVEQATAASLHMEAVETVAVSTEQPAELSTPESPESQPQPAAQLVHAADEVARQSDKVGTQVSEAAGDALQPAAAGLQVGTTSGRAVPAAITGDRGSKSAMAALQQLWATTRRTRTPASVAAPSDEAGAKRVKSEVDATPLRAAAAPATSGSAKKAPRIAVPRAPGGSRVAGWPFASVATNVPAPAPAAFAAAAGRLAPAPPASSARPFRNTLPFASRDLAEPARPATTGASSTGAASSAGVTRDRTAAARPRPGRSNARKSRQATERFPSLKAPLTAAAERDPESTAQVAEAPATAALASIDAAPTAILTDESAMRSPVANPVPAPVEGADGELAQTCAPALPVESIAPATSVEANDTAALDRGDAGLVIDVTFAATPIALPAALDVDGCVGDTASVVASDESALNSPITLAGEATLDSASPAGLQPVECVGAPAADGDNAVVESAHGDPPVAATVNTALEPCDQDVTDELTGDSGPVPHVDEAAHEVVVDFGIATSTPQANAVWADVDPSPDAEAVPVTVAATDAADPARTDSVDVTLENDVLAADTSGSGVETRALADVTAGERPSSPDVRRTWFGAPSLDSTGAVLAAPADCGDPSVQSAVAGASTALCATSIGLGAPPPALGFGRPRHTVDAEEVALLLRGITERNSVSPFEVLRRGPVSPREDGIQPVLQARERSTRRWPWVAAVGAGLGAYVSLLALVGPPSPHAASRPHEDAAPAAPARAEGQMFPITRTSGTAVDSADQAEIASTPSSVEHEVASSSVSELPAQKSPSPAERSEVARSSASELPAQKTAPGTTNIERSKLRRTDRQLDSLQIARETRVQQPRPAVVPEIVASPVISPVRPGPAPAAAQTVAFGDVWATPSVINAAGLRPHPRPVQVAEPPAVAPANPLPLAAARTEDLEVRGSLADSAVRRAIERIRPQFTGCFLQHAPSPAAGNVARVELTIDENGRARDPRAHGASSALDACLVQASRKIVAGAPDTGTVKAVWNVRYSR